MELELVNSDTGRSFVLRAGVDGAVFLNTASRAGWRTRARYTPCALARWITFSVHLFTMRVHGEYNYR